MFTNTEIHYLRGTNEYLQRMFDEAYLEFLRRLRLPEYRVRRTGSDLQVTFSGPWAEVTYWETVALSIINETYYRTLLRSLSKFERERIIGEYEQVGVDPKEKMLVASDALDLPVILQTQELLGARIRVSYGWGTGLTNDLLDNVIVGDNWFGPLSLVVKPTHANGRALVKLSIPQKPSVSRRTSRATSAPLGIASVRPRR